MLPSEQKKALAELEQSGANKDYIRSKVLACINNQSEGFAFMMEENRVFR